MAQDWAHANGKQTVELTKGGGHLDGLDLFGLKGPTNLTGQQVADIWNVGDYGERTWWRIEKRILVKSPSVTRIRRRKKNGEACK